MQHEGLLITTVRIKILKDADKKLENDNFAA
jgi:hypothetical protein